MPLVYGLLVGVAMGTLIQRVGASSPKMILAALRLEDLTIIKFMATTIGVGTIATYLLSLGMPMHFDVKPTYVIGVAVGGLIFGAGFAIGGYCPGTCVVGISEGRRDGLVALLGGIFGALLFTLGFPFIESSLIKPYSYGKITWGDLLHVPTVALAVVFGVVLLALMKVMPTRRRAT